MQRVGPVVTLQLVPLPSRAPFSLSPLGASVESEAEEEERARRHPTRLPLVSLASPFAARPLAHAMINITPQSYGIQTDLETDFFFLLKASSWGRRGARRNFRPETFPARETGNQSEKLKAGAVPAVWITSGNLTPRSFPMSPSLPPAAGKSRNGVDNSPGNCVARLDCHMKSLRLIS